MTENDPGNAGMLAINDRLGYEPVVEEYFTRELAQREGPAGKRG